MRGPLFSNQGIKGQGLLKMNIKLFIELIKGNPILYDYRNSSYKDNKEKEKKCKMYTMLGVTGMLCYVTLDETS